MKTMYHYHTSMMRSRKGCSGKRGFTMIELLVVATIIVLMSTIGLVSYRSAAQNARDGRRKSDMEAVRAALVLYRSDNGTYPSGSNFGSMLDTLQAADYFSDQDVEDPQEGNPDYTYSSDGSTFTVCATLEEGSGTPYCVDNP